MTSMETLRISWRSAARAILLVAGLTGVAELFLNRNRPRK